MPEQGWMLSEQVSESVGGWEAGREGGIMGGGKSVSLSLVHANDETLQRNSSQAPAHTQYLGIASGFHQSSW